MNNQTRRAALKATALAIAGIAGCSSLGGAEKNSSSSGGEPQTAAKSDAGTLEETATERQTEAKIKALQQRVDQLLETVVEKEQRISTLESELSAERERLERLQYQLKNRTHRVGALESSLEERKQRIDDLESKLKKRENRIDSLESKLSGSSNEYSDEVLDLAKETGLSTRNSVVHLRAERERGYSIGTGWFLKDDLIVTNGHVVGSAEEFTCWLPDGEPFSATVVDSHHGSYGDLGHIDIGIIRADRTGPILETGNSDKLSRDQPLVQVGHPGFVGNWTISLGRYIEENSFFGFLTSIPTMSGSSGSPVVDLAGEVVGLTGGEIDDERSSSDANRPKPDSDSVRTSFDDETYATHNPIESVMEFVDDVTD
ncbi:trypsin-like peptidase domain-containing protein [Halosimplex halobium]|uniref:trypsin-like peptidase domain-containing protein n=1 Tax=Halosimplex halobium TaxID=3396618 RepID=UPI003F5516DF